MGLVDFFKKKRIQNVLVSNLGEFLIKEEFGENIFIKHNCSSFISQKFDLKFSVLNNNITDIQLEIYYLIEKNWSELHDIIKTKLKLDSKISVKIIAITGKENSNYDYDAEIVFESDNSLFSAIVVDGKIDEIIPIE